MNRTWLRLQSRLHSTVYRASKGRLGSHFGAPALLLTTTGRKSGQQRTTPLFYIEKDGYWVVVASNAGSDKQPAWWLNLQTRPEAMVQVKAATHLVQARQANTAEAKQLWPSLLALFPGYETYRQMSRREIPIILLHPFPEIN